MSFNTECHDAIREWLICKNNMPQNATQEFSCVAEMYNNKRSQTSKILKQNKKCVEK